MKWYQKALTENRDEIIRAAVASVVVAFLFSLWRALSGVGFEWRSIAPIEAPGLLPRLFYSALVYVTFGAVLYVVGFYKFLHDILVKILGSWALYNMVKKLLWLSLIAVTYFYVVPAVVGWLNVIISFCYNVTMLLVYLLPSFGIFLAVFCAALYFLKFNKNKGVIVFTEPEKAA